MQALAATDPGTSVWTFSPADRTAGSGTGGGRRRPGSTATTPRPPAGAPTPIPTDLAVDGVDEFLTVFLARLPVGDAVGEATIHFHCTDADGEWLLTRVGDDVVVTREHAKGDVAARGSASDLALFLWGRVGADRLEVFGDAAALDRFRSAVKV